MDDAMPLRTSQAEGMFNSLFNKGDEESPWMWPVHYQPFQQDSGDLFLNCFCVGFSKKVQEGAAEVVSVTVGVAQLIGDGIQEQVSACNKCQERNCNT
ncbi:hypothetical protein E2C01_003758 [Portunus trituberculatus]|uniref:Uncharacterized protein n=1 Tax=Portunus trituberculatus TaxID=210409 RepID=A0A5B7CS34_PORTR|nr:hypothetical protein [Portunus trituberculatus]